MKISNKAIEFYCYRAPMPLENVRNNYFYCAPGGLPPLPPRKKMKTAKLQHAISNSNNNNNNNDDSKDNLSIYEQFVNASRININNNNNDYNEDDEKIDSWWASLSSSRGDSSLSSSSSSSIIVRSTVKVRRQVSWPENLDTHKQMVIIDRKDAAFARNVGSPFEGDWFYDARDDVDWDNEKWEDCVDEEHSDAWRTGASCYDAVDEEEEEEEGGIVGNNVPSTVQTQFNECSQSVESKNSMHDDIHSLSDSDHGEEDDDDDDDGSDFYFSIPATHPSTISAVDCFAAVGVDSSVGNHEKQESNATTDVAIPFVAQVHEEGNMYSPMSVPTDVLITLEACNNEEEFIPCEDVKEDMEVVLSINVTAVPPLGSIWVNDPNLGLVRRSARLRARG